jgi:IclR family mhp operon transcriptional activator
VTEDDDPQAPGSLGPIRAISRAVAVLQAVNREGSMTVAQIAQSARVPYPTAYRILHALIHEGLIEREPSRKLYRPTALVRSLAHGYQDHSRLTGTARPYLLDFTARTHWPAMVATPVGVNMVVRDATHSLAPMALSHYYAGFTFPMLGSAAGAACLAFYDDEDRARHLQGIEQTDPDADRFLLEGFKSGALVQDIRDRGYASRPRNRLSNPPGKTSSIAAPILRHGQPVAALSVVIISSALRLAEAEARYAEDVVSMARAIGATLEAPEPEEA